MEVACLKSMGSELSAPDHGFWYSPSTHFPVTIGNRYRVVGMSLYNHRLAYLVENDASRPDWLPVGLFSIIDPRLPSDWSFRFPRSPVICLKALGDCKVFGDIVNSQVRWITIEG